MTILKYLFLLICSSLSSALMATTLVVPAHGNIVGTLQTISPRSGETLADIGIRYDVGYESMVRANPNQDASRPLPLRAQVLVPTLHILPDVPHEGVVVNLAEYRLYYFPPHDNVVITVPVGIGRAGWNTPLGVTRVVAKEVNPIWRPTANVRAEAANNGTPIPDQFPPGPGNPLGQHVLRLGWPTYLIHGTNRVDGVGARVSAGCIRLQPDDIANLYPLIPVGTPVRVINEPVKMGQLNNQTFIEVHPNLQQYPAVNLSQKIAEKIQRKMLPGALLNSKVVKEEVKYPSGVPMALS